MKGGGKAAETYRNTSDFNCPSSDMPCRNHPYPSPVGICPYCLKDRLVKLVCAECGRQRLSSCSCSDIFSSNQNSCSATDVGSVGKISFLIDNEKIYHQQRNPHSKSKRKDEKPDQIIFLGRSSSSCAEIKKSNGFWRIKRLFWKKRNEGRGENAEFSDENSAICVSDITRLSRSKSLCYRGGRNDDFDEGRDYAFSTAKIYNVSTGILFDSDKQFGFPWGVEARRTGFRGNLDGENGIGLKRGGRGGCLNQIEIDRVYNVPNRRVFPIKESDFSVMDESAFVDLKLDLLSDSRKDFSVARISGVSDHANSWKNKSFEKGENLASLKGSGSYENGGGSCRITINERGLKQGSRNYRAWNWIFKYRSAAKEEI